VEFVKELYAKVHAVLNVRLVTRWCAWMRCLIAITVINLSVTSVRPRKKKNHGQDPNAACKSSCVKTVKVVTGHIHVDYVEKRMCVETMMLLLAIVERYCARNVRISTQPILLVHFVQNKILKKK
jgi:hypothetical protein